MLPNYRVGGVTVHRVTVWEWECQLMIFKQHKQVVDLTEGFAETKLLLAVRKGGLVYQNFLLRCAS